MFHGRCIFNLCKWWKCWYSGRRGYYISGDSGNNYYTDHMSINIKLNANSYVQIRNGGTFHMIIFMEIHIILGSLAQKDN